jgi:hypothetical protein
VASTTINQFPYPAASDPPNGPAQIQSLALAVDKRSVSVFANDAARDAAIPSPTTGMACVSGSRFLVYRAGAWAKQGGPRELLYENGNAGASGVVAVGAGLTGVLSVNVPAAGVAADTAHVHLSVGILSTGSTVGSVVLLVNGIATAPQVFNIGVSSTPIPVVLEAPSTIPAATFAVGVNLQATSGSGCSVAYSAIRVTF